MKLWKGRFSKQATSSANRFNASIEVDQRMYRQDILGSIAHGKMLAHQGIISDAERDAIIRGLNEILKSMKQVLFNSLLKMKISIWELKVY